jgi:hypothetical protein
MINRSGIKFRRPDGGFFDGPGNKQGTKNKNGPNARMLPNGKSG